jgi:hypothetical protein
MECFEDKGIFEGTSPGERRGPGGAKLWWGASGGKIEKLTGIVGARVRQTQPQELP